MPTFSFMIQVRACHTVAYYQTFGFQGVRGWHKCSNPPAPTPGYTPVFIHQMRPYQAHIVAICKEEATMKAQGTGDNNFCTIL